MENPLPPPGEVTGRHKVYMSTGELCFYFYRKSSSFRFDATAAAN